jgi:hypothetical protein
MRFPALSRELLADKCNLSMIMNPLLLTLVAFAALVATANAQFSSGNLAVVRVGNGTETLGNVGNSVFIDQFTTAVNGYVNSVIVPNSGGTALIMNGTSTSEGYLKFDANNSLLTFGGYNTAVGGTTRLDYTPATTVNRAVGQVTLAGTYSQPFKTIAAFGGVTGTSGQVRSVATDGNNYWGGGTASGSIGGTYYFGSGSPGSVEAGPGDRNLGLFNGSLFFSISSSTYGYGVRKFTGTPTTTASSSVFLNTFGSGTGNPSPYDFSFDSSMSTAYVADDRSTANGGGIQKWVSSDSGTTWTLSYTWNTISAGSGGGTFTARGLAVDWSGANPVVYATTTATSNNKLISINDLGSGSQATVLDAAGVNMVFRGVVLIPEPTTGALLGLGLLLFLSRRGSPRRS